MNTNFSYFSDNTFGQKENYTYKKGLSTRINTNYKVGNISTKFSFKASKDQTNIDGSFFEYSKNIVKFGVGKINRNWSFSDNTSLALSSNASPPKSTYIKLEDTFDNKFLPKSSSWSFEAFNASTTKTLLGNNSMLFGNRLTFSPIKTLNFELIRTSQWGGGNYGNKPSDFFKVLFVDSNEIAPHINHMAGFGFSYLSEFNKNPTRIYGQVIGEDEAGLLPMCFMHLVGLELNNQFLQYSNMIGLELVDTRVNETSHGFCGANTAYNNNTYPYTNNGTVMGSYLDTEGKSIKMFGKLKIDNNLSLKYSIESATINDKNWPDHRLSSKKVRGHLSTMGLSWVEDNFEINGNLYYGDIALDKQNIDESLSISIATRINF
jgi:hypothetical protein